jgi:hypothetical protein
MRLFLAIILRILIIPQTSFDNLVVRQFNESGLFANYAEAKQVVSLATWGCLFAFLALNLWLGLLWHIEFYFSWP